MCNDCFIRVNDFMLVFVWERSTGNVVTGYWRILCRGFGFVSSLMCRSYFLTLMLSVNGFVELPAISVSELGCHVSINFMRI